MVRLERPLSLGPGVKQAAPVAPVPPPPRPKAISPPLLQGRRASRNGREDVGGLSFFTLALLKFLLSLQ